MTVSDVPLLGMLKAKMRWHEARQRLLAENVANSDTPGFRPRELKPFSFEPRGTTQLAAAVGTARTDATHLAAGFAPNEPFASDQAEDLEVTPAGNGVVLEEEMMKVAANQFDYQLASSVYARSLGLIRSALGRSA